MELVFNEFLSIIHDYKLLIFSVWILSSISIMHRFIITCFGLLESKKKSNIKSNKNQFFISCKSFLCRFKRYKYKIILEKKPNRLLNKNL